jgi:sugar phosphate isomerase/epimerase
MKCFNSLFIMLFVLNYSGLLTNQEKNDMIFTLSTVIFDGPLEIKDIRNIKKSGIKNIELNYNYDLSPRIFYSLNNSKIEIISAHSPFFEWDISNTEESVRIEATKQNIMVIDQISKYNAKYFILHPGIWMGENNKIKLMESSIRSLTTILNHAAKKNISLAIENLPPGFLGDDVYELDHILKKVRSNSLYPEKIGVCLDSGHAFLKNNLSDYLDYFKKDIIYMHIHDNKGDRNGNKEKAVDDLHEPPGIGKIDWGFFFHKLSDQQYSGPLSFEIRKRISKNGEDSIFLLIKFMKLLSN